VKGQDMKIVLGEFGEGAGQNIKIDWVRLREIKYSIELVQGGRWRVTISNVPGRIQGEAEGQDIKFRDIPRQIQGRRQIVLGSSRGQDSKYSRESNVVSSFLLCDLSCAIVIQLAQQLDDAVHPAITPYSD